MRRIAFLAPLLCLAADRLLKYIVFTEPLRARGEVFRFGALSVSPFLNNRLAFGIPLALPLIIFGSSVVIGVLIWYGIRTPSFLHKMSCAFIILGALSNLFDRIVFHAVHDYLSLLPNGFFNIADLMIGGGIALLFF